MDIVERLGDRLKGAKRVNPRLTEEEMETVEEMLGFKLPNLLRRLYLEVGNGGYGPSVGFYGLLSFGNGTKEHLDKGIVKTYKRLCKMRVRSPIWKWPEQLLPICELGYDLCLCVDCSTGGGATIKYYSGYENSLESCFVPFTSSIEEWLLIWLDKIESKKGLSGKCL